MKQIADHQWLLSGNTTSSDSTFSSQAAQALKATYDAILSAETQREYLASVSQQHPRWLDVKNMGTGELTLYHQAQNTNWVYLGGGVWQVPPQHDERVAAPVAAVKRCTCGGASVGGGHSHWCDIDG